MKAKYLQLPLSDEFARNAMVVSWAHAVLRSAPAEADKLIKAHVAAATDVSRHPIFRLLDDWELRDVCEFDTRLWVRYASKEEPLTSDRGLFLSLEMSEPRNNNDPNPPIPDDWRAMLEIFTELRDWPPGYMGNIIPLHDIRRLKDRAEYESVVEALQDDPIINYPVIYFAPDGDLLCVAPNGEFWWVAFAEAKTLFCAASTHDVLRDMANALCAPG